MAKCARRSTIFCFFACFLLLAAITPVFGKGSKEPDLSKADELITAREYDEATIVLSDYIRRYPDNFDLANQRLRKIYQIRDEFNRLADELINLLINEPENSEKQLSLTLRLRELENDNSPLMVNFVSKAQQIAQFNVYRNQLRNIMERGRYFLDINDVEDALQIYAGGMGIMRDEFFAAGYGVQIEREVQQETQRINSIIASFRPDNTQLAAISTDLVRAINAGQTPQISALITRLTPIIDDFTKLKQEMFNSVNNIDRILEELRKADPGMGDRNHLAFLSRIIHGRAEEDVQEGMLGAFDTSWKNSVGNVIDIITSNIESIYTASLTSFNNGEFSNVASSIARNENYINLSPQFFDKHRQFQSGGNPQTISLYGNVVLDEDIPSYLKIISLIEASNAILKASNVAIRLVFDRSSLSSWQEGRISLDEALQREQQTRNNIANMKGEFETIKADAVQIDTDISAHHDVPYIKDAISAIDKLASSFITEERMSAQRYYTIENSFLERNLAVRKEQFEKGRSLLEGQRRTNEDGSETIYRYPAEALQEFTALLSIISSDIERGDSVLTQFRNEPEAVASNAEITGLRSRYQTNFNELNNIRNQSISLSETARGRTSLADSYRQEGEQFFRDAQAAYNRQNYEEAKKNIDLAAERFNSSLEMQESASLRETWDNQMLNLSRAIAAAINERIIQEVRNLVDTARDLYFEGDFQTAENNLVRARERWLSINTEENEEISYWLGMVSGGTSARSSRVINATEPLYPEMSQLLSQAQRNYEEGVRLINASQRSQGLGKFDEARVQTREVRLVFPLNQQAGLIELRIEQFIDPVAFNGAFEQRIRTAIAGTTPPQRSMDAYADLLNLSEINPNYPGIRGIINQAEINLGLRPPPPNPANIARSRELTASANSILQRNLITQFDLAMQNVNEAIRLDPNNREATRVKDLLNNRMAPPGSIISIEAEDQYNRALREFQAGNNVVALGIVNTLLQNPNNRVQKVLLLQQRIQQALR